jgi:hypothetical protein
MGGKSSEVFPEVPWLSTPRLRSMPVPLISHGFWSHSNGDSVMNKLLATIVTAIGFILPLVLSAAGRDGDHYAKVEIKGIIQTDMVAIGGETTGTVIKVGDLSLDLDLGENRTLQELVERLHGKTVLIKGTLTRIKGIERGERDVVVVESLSEFD